MEGSTTCERSSHSDALFRARLVDQVELRVCPTALGEGRRFFPAGVGHLELVGSTTYDAGVAILRYRVRKASGPE